MPTLVEVLRIGSLDDTCDAFGKVMSLAVDGDGRIYVADYQGNDVRVFSPQGECVRSFGRSGEGPGEFRLLAGIAWQPPEYLWAIDSSGERFTVFDSLGLANSSIFAIHETTYSGDALRTVRLDRQAPRLEVFDERG